MSKYTTELFRSWENGVRNEQETHWIVPKGNAKAVAFKREEIPSYATACAGVWHNGECEVSREGP